VETTASFVFLSYQYRKGVPRMRLRHVDDVPREEVKAGNGAHRQVLIGPDEAPHFALRRFIMAPGGGIPAHTNTVEHEQYVLRGRATVGIGDETFEVRPGNVLYIPAGVPHWYEVLGNEPFEFLCMVPNETDRIEMVKGGGRG
jgi:quercetin dioxygenase-like cupin family protein